MEDRWRWRCLEKKQNKMKMMMLLMKKKEDEEDDGNPEYLLGFTKPLA